ncbi:MAG TPA: iron-containing alcohol dehydrogenase [Armatimonadota bacterium]|nr:iron-containing alcohol dehydrogenase [Armatimonadota bacterium]
MHEFRLPGVIHFGWGAVERVGEEAARLGRRALLATGRSAMKRAGVSDRITALLSGAGVEVVLFDEVESDPSGTTIDRGAQRAREEGCDLVVGLGGGSAMDGARAIAAMAVLDGSIIDYVRGKPIDRAGLPLVNIATTSGTASEVTPVSVVLDEERKLKMGIKSPFWFSRVAVTDPELTMTMPPALTAATGLDALTHAAESYISTGATPPSEALALRAVELIGANLRAAFADGRNRAAREGMAMSSMMAGMAFANSGLGLVHGLVHPIGSRFGVPHGEGCGRLLPHVLRYNATAVPAKVAVVGAALTGKNGVAAEEAAEAVVSLLRDLQVPAGIGDLGIPDNRLPELAKDGLLAGAVRTNPRAVGEEDARALLEEARKVQ